MTDSIQNNAILSARQRAIAQARLEKKPHGQIEDTELRKLAVEVAAGIFQGSYYRGLPAVSISNSIKFANMLIARAASDANLARIDELLEKTPVGQGALSPSALASEPAAIEVPATMLDLEEANLLVLAKRNVDAIEAERRKYEADADLALLNAAGIAVEQEKSVLDPKTTL